MKPIDTTLIDKTSAFIASRFGLHFSGERLSDLVRHLRQASHELGFNDFDRFLRSLLSQQLTIRQTETLVNHLTVGETYFLRDPAVFLWLEQKILPNLVAQRAKTGLFLRFWSAGCCTGEEPYSIAIACIRAIPSLRENNLSIIATDLNSHFLAKARIGVYSEWSFRNSPNWFRKQFFSPVENRRFAIHSSVKQFVHFNYINLATDIYPSLQNHTDSLDIIFCRNVLMYFTPEQQRKVVTAFYHCLVEDGIVVVSAAEANAELFSLFTQERQGEVIFFRKNSSRTEVSA